MIAAACNQEDKNQFASIFKLTKNNKEIINKQDKYGKTALFYALDVFFLF